MPSTSKSNRRRKAKKSKFIQKPTVKEPTRNWLELPSDIMANILYRVGVYDILENAQKVCTTWRKICKDPAMWRVISLINYESCTSHLLREMCKHAVDRSQGQLLDLTIKDYADYELLQYVAERSSQLKRLEIIYRVGKICGAWGDVLKKFPLLEELCLHATDVLSEDIEAAGRYCPLLKTLKVNMTQLLLYKFKDNESITSQNVIAIAIGKTLPALRHLELIGNKMSDIGLKAILDGCCHLETLDLRRCLHIDLNGDVGKECVKKITNLKLPDDSLEDYPHIHEYVRAPWDVTDDSVENLDDFDDYGYFDHDDYGNFDHDDYGYYDHDHHGYFDHDDYRYYDHDHHGCFDHDDYGYFNHDDYTTFGNEDSSGLEDMNERMFFMSMYE